MSRLSQNWQSTWVQCWLSPNWWSTWVQCSTPASHLRPGLAHYQVVGSPISCITGFGNTSMVYVSCNFGHRTNASRLNLLAGLPTHYKNGSHNLHWGYLPTGKTGHAGSSRLSPNLHVVTIPVKIKSMSYTAKHQGCNKCGLMLEWQQDNRTNPTIAMAIISGLQAWNIETTPNTNPTNQAFANQFKIGWLPFL